MQLTLAKKMLLASFMFLLPIFLLEAGLRIFTSQESQWNVRIGGSKEFDPITRVRNKPNYQWPGGVVTNEKGYLAPPGIQHEKPRDTVRTIFMGDSVTFFPVDRNYPTIIEEEWERDYGIEVETLNAAVAGYASDNIRAMYESEIRNFEADYFFLYVGWNDLGQYGPEGLPFKRSATGYEVSTFERIISNIYTIRIVYALQRYLQHDAPSFNRPLEPADAKLYEGYQPTHFEENVRAILRDAKQRYPRVYLANLATITNPDPTPWELETAHYPAGMEKNMQKLDLLVKSYNEVVEKLSREEGVPLIDFYSAFDNRDARKLMTDSCHVKEPGARLFASVVREAAPPPVGVSN